MGIETAILGSAVLGAYGANKAAGAQTEAANTAAGVQRDIFERQTQLQEPWRQAGINALAKMQSGDVQNYMDPAYQFRLSEGLKALQRNAASRGGLISGGALKAAEGYGQNLASQEWGNAYNRLAGLAGVGQSATNQLGSAASGYGSNVGNLMTDAANARASSYAGMYGAATGGLNQYLNYSQNQQRNALLQQALQNQGGTGKMDWFE
jgi:hypothetical protein